MSDWLVSALPCCQVVALNSTLGAEGELYIDDGKSYKFKQGEYIHRKFTFSAGQLKSAPLQPDAATLRKGPASNGKFQTPCVVERVIVMGLPDSILQKTTQVGLVSDGVTLTAEVRMRGLKQ